MPTRIKESFTNKFGQTINVGDKVAAAVLSNKYVRTYEGTYIGYVGEGERKRVQIMTGPRYSWQKIDRIATLWDNNVFLLENTSANL